MEVDAWGGLELVEEVVDLEAREARVALGDSLPAGLRLVTDDDQG